jgi:hypothetical protein
MMRLEMARESFLERLRRERDELASKPAGDAPNDDLSSIRPAKTNVFDSNFRPHAETSAKMSKKKVFDASDVTEEDSPPVKKSKKTKGAGVDEGSSDSGLEMSKPTAKSEGKTAEEVYEDGKNDVSRDFFYHFFFHSSFSTS